MTNGRFFSTSTLYTIPTIHGLVCCAAQYCCAYVYLWNRVFNSPVTDKCCTRHLNLSLPLQALSTRSHELQGLAMLGSMVWLRSLQPPSRMLQRRHDSFLVRIPQELAYISPTGSLCIKLLTSILSYRHDNGLRAILLVSFVASH